MVPETATGTRRPSVGERLVDPEQRGLHVAGVLAGLEQQVVRSALHEPQRLLAEVGDEVSKVTPPVTEIAGSSAPWSPPPSAVRPGRSAAAHASRARRAAARLISRARAPSPYSASTSGVAPKVSVSTTSQPASR